MDLSQNLLNLLNEPQGRDAFAIYFTACVLGQVGHAVWMWLKKEIPCIAGRFKEDPRATAVSIITNLGVIGGVAVLIPFGNIPLQAAFLMGLTQGFSSDSAVNKSAREIWTPAERAAAAEKKAQ